MNNILKLIALFGILLYGTLFLMTFVSSEKIEDSAKAFVKSQIEKEIRAKQKLISESAVTDAVLNLAAELGFEKEKIQADLDNNLPEKIAGIIASMCGYDCENKKALAQSISSGYLERIKNIRVAEQTLSDIVKGTYLEILSNLKRDLRIFLISNLTMFFIILVVSFLKPSNVQHLFLPGTLLALATMIAASLYIFGQDWFYTILYNDYMGFGYLVYVGVIFGILMDISLNKAKVTTEIINGIANAFGSAFSVVAC